MKHERSCCSTELSRQASKEPDGQSLRQTYGRNSLSYVIPAGNISTAGIHCRIDEYICVTGIMIVIIPLAQNTVRWCMGMIPVAVIPYRSAQPAGQRVITIPASKTIITSRNRSFMAPMVAVLVLS